MSELLNRVEQSIRALGLFRPGQRIVVAVSGGLDSMVLLHLLHALAPKHRWRLAVAHLNHQLRGRSSNADERFVRQTAQKLKLPVVVERADVRLFAREQRLSIEMAARALRHDFLARSARRQHASAVGLAHHADDQLELFFLRLLRGSGGEGLAGMKWRSPSPADRTVNLVRPLLDQPKAALADYAAEQDLRHREDRTNALLDFQRNRIRHELLPLLRAKYQPALARTIARVIDIVGAEAELAAAAAAEWLKGRGRRLAFDRLPVAVQRRCLHLQLRRLGVEPEYYAVEHLRTRSERAVALGKVCGAVRDSAGIVRLQAPRQERFRADSTLIKLEGRAGQVEFGGTLIQWRISSRKPAKTPPRRAGREWFDGDKVGAAVRLRHWLPGDRFQPIGMSNAVKLQDFFTNQKVPRDRRRQLILATTARGEVFWVQNARISERFKLTGQTNRYLQWRWKSV